MDAVVCWKDLPEERRNWCLSCVLEEHGTGNGRIILQRAFRHLEQEVLGSVARVLRNLPQPDARWIRIPVGLLLVLGDFFSILTFLGIWMLSLGLLLIAYDVPLLREPVGRFTIWGIGKWTSLRQRFFPRPPES